MGFPPSISDLYDFPSHSSDQVEGALLELFCSSPSFGLLLRPGLVILERKKKGKLTASSVFKILASFLSLAVICHLDFRVLRQLLLASCLWFLITFSNSDRARCVYSIWSGARTPLSFLSDDFIGSTALS